MKFPFPLHYGGASLIVAVSLLLVPVRAQRPAPKPTPARTATTTPQTPAAEKSPAVTFDTLLSADAYGIYAEMRAVGQYADSQEIAQLLAPFNFKGSGNDELLALYEFIKSQADALMTSRLMFATMPTRAGLPEMLLAVEMPSAEEARKFVPELRQFVASSVKPPPPVAPSATTASTTTTTTTYSYTPPRRGRRGARVVMAENATGGRRAKQTPVPQFQIKRAGSLITMSGAAFAFKDLRGADEALLFNEPDFQAARARFSTDTLFVYFNTVRINSSTKQMNEAREKEWRRQEQEIAKAHSQQRGKSGRTNADTGIEEETAVLSGGNANAQIDENGNYSITMSGNTNVNTNMNVVISPESEIAPAPPTPEATSTPMSEKELEAERQREQSRQFVQTLAAFAFNDPGGSNGSWPESIGVGASLEADALVVRGLFISPSADQALRPIPFLPVLLSGPSVPSEAAAVLPADTNIFVSASLDLPQMYDHLASLMKIAEFLPGQEEGKTGFGEQLAAFEKTNNFRIREDLLAALGNEIAVGLPGSQFFPSAPQPTRTDDSATPRAAGPIIVIALNDRESLQKLLPRVLSAVGFAGASEQNIVEKHGEVEVLTFSNGTLAFIDRFLVAAPDAATMRRVADAYNDGKTLANSEGFRDSTNWQSKQAIGQVYVANAMLKDMFKEVTNSTADIDDPAIRAYLMRLDPNPGSITHLATRESNGLMHELRLPKNLLTFFAVSDIISEKLSTIRGNEFRAQHQMRMISSAQNGHKINKGHYGTLEELNAAGLVLEEFGPTVVDGYEIKVSVSGDTFEATATPTGYPKLGRRSFYIDQTGALRGGDTGGKPATESSPIIE